MLKLFTFFFFFFSVYPLEDLAIPNSPSLPYRHKIHIATPIPSINVSNKIVATTCLLIFINIILLFEGLCFILQYVKFIPFNTNLNLCVKNVKYSLHFNMIPNIFYNYYSF